MKPVGNETTNIIDTPEVRFDKLNKHELEALRTQITKELNTRYPNSRKSKYCVPVEEKIPTSEELEMIFTATDNLKYRLFFKTLVYTGCRPCEVIRLKLEDLDFKNECFYVWVAKKRSPIKLPKYFPEVLEPELKLWIKSRYNEIKKHNDYLFFNKRTLGSREYISTTQASKIFRASLEKTNLERFYTIADDRNNPIAKEKRKLRNYNLKSLRKYFVSKVYSNSKDGLMASRLLHHEHVDTTSNYYLGISKESKLEVLNKTFNEKRRNK